MRQPHPTHRAALFTFADARGNNPHGTRETAYDEGRRLNAGRYETVGDLDRAFDVRARPRLIARQLAGPVAPQPEPAPTGIVGVLALMAVGAGIAYVLMKKDRSEAAEEFEEFEAPAALPSPTTQTVTVLPAAPAAPIPNPAPVVVVAPPPPPVEAPKRRRRRAAVATVVPEPLGT